MHSRFKAALVSSAAATLVLTTAGLAMGDTASPDGDTVKQPDNISYGSGGQSRPCSTRGEAVPGIITIDYVGSSHYIPGEELDVVFDAPAGVTAATVAATNRVPNPWSSAVGSFTIPFTTTVSASSAGGSVAVDVIGKTSRVSADGKPAYSVHVDCVPPVPGDTTVPTLALSHVPDGDNDWNRTSPVTVTATAGDNVGVTSIVCSDTYNGTVSNPVVTLTSTGGSFPIAGDGVHAITCVAQDAAGNESQPATDVVKIDTVPPTITYEGTVPSAPSGTDDESIAWFKTSVTLSWSCADATSGPVATTDSATLDEENTSRAAAQSATGHCEDVAGWTAEDERGGINIDKTAPSLNIAGPASGDVDICTAATRPTFVPTDALSGVNPDSKAETWSPPSVFGLGSTWEYTARADDYATNTASETRRYTATTYGSAYSRLLQPINREGNSRFKLGSTIPVKFRLSCDGIPVTNAQATLWVWKKDATPDVGVDEAVSTSAATSGNLFRYSASDQQYIFNLNTKGTYKNPNGQEVTMTAGSWTLYVDLGDGSPRQATDIQVTK